MDVIQHLLGLMAHGAPGSLEAFPLLLPLAGALLLAQRRGQAQARVR